MPELLKFEYYRILKSKIIWVMLALAALMPVFAAVVIQVLFVNLSGGDLDSLDFEVGNIRFFTWYVISYFYERVPLILALFIPLFLGRDYRDGVIRNKLTAGHKRYEIFFSAVITQVSVAVVLCLVYVFAGLAAMALTDIGVDINRGEMFARAFTLLFSLIATTVLFVVVSLLIKSRAGTVVICISLIFLSGLIGNLASNFCYSRSLAQEYVDAYNEMIDDDEDGYGYGSFINEEAEISDYLNAGWYIGHPIFLTTNASMSNELVGNLSNVFSFDSDEVFVYPKKISRMGFLRSSLSMFMGNYGSMFVNQDDIDGAVISVSQALVEYNVKSFIWLGIYLGGGYAVFRKKNIF